MRILIFAIVAISFNSFADGASLPTFECSNKNGSFLMEPVAEPKCSGADKECIEYKFIGGEGLLSGGIPEYDESMPGWIGLDKAESAKKGKTVFSFMDGGVWEIKVTLPKKALSAKPGKRLKAIVDSWYSDVDETDLPGVKVTCTVK